MWHELHTTSFTAADYCLNEFCIAHKHDAHILFQTWRKKIGFGTGKKSIAAESGK